MQDSFRSLVDSLLRPERPCLPSCLREREHHRAAQTRIAERRARALAQCRANIESAREAVFAANNGHVSARMTKLEREWRTLSRTDPDAGCMDLWARIAPYSWIDRKRWRDSEPAVRADVATALAADVSGVEAAESAIASLRVALAAWGTTLGPQIRWSPFERDADAVTGLLAEPLRVACEAVAVGDTRSIVGERTRQLSRIVHEAVRERFPERPLLAQAIAHAAFVDGWLRAAALADLPDPVAPLRELWSTGYGLVVADGTGVTLEIPSL